MENYIILEMIGEGAFGKVYKGQRKCTNQIVAIKKIDKKNKKEKELKNLRQEIDIIKKLYHENIIQFLDSFETSAEICLVTELATGQLYEIVQEDKKLPESEIKNIALQLTSALSYLHNNNIIHRDIKPQNILISASGIIKICDFGFARAIDNKTMITSIKGTPLYMAPELLKDYPYNKKADLWSLGVILYELYVGQPPYYTNNFKVLIEKATKEEVRYPDSMSQQFKDFLKGLLMKNPKDRWDWSKILVHPFLKENEEERKFRLESEENYRKWIIRIKNDKIFNLHESESFLSKFANDLENDIGTKNFSSFANINNKPQSSKKNPANANNKEDFWSVVEAKAATEEGATSLRKDPNFAEKANSSLKECIKDDKIVNKELANSIIKILFNVLTKGKFDSQNMDLTKNNQILSTAINIFKISQKDDSLNSLLNDIIKVIGLFTKFYCYFSGVIDLGICSGFLRYVPDVLTAKGKQPNLYVNMLKAVGLMITAANIGPKRSLLFYKSIIDFNIINVLFQVIKNYQNQPYNLTKSCLDCLAILVHPTNGEIHSFMFLRNENVESRFEGYNEVKTAFSHIQSLKKHFFKLCQDENIFDLLPVLYDLENEILLKTTILRIILQLFRFNPSNMINYFLIKGGPYQNIINSILTSEDVEKKVLTQYGLLILIELVRYCNANKIPILNYGYEIQKALNYINRTLANDNTILCLTFGLLSEALTLNPNFKIFNSKLMKKIKEMIRNSPGRGRDENKKLEGTQFGYLNNTILDYPLFYLEKIVKLYIQKDSTKVDILNAIKETQFEDALIEVVSNSSFRNEISPRGVSSALNIIYDLISCDYKMVIRKVLREHCTKQLVIFIKRKQFIAIQDWPGFPNNDGAIIAKNIFIVTLKIIKSIAELNGITEGIVRGDFFFNLKNSFDIIGKDNYRLVVSILNTLSSSRHDEVVASTCYDYFSHSQNLKFIETFNMLKDTHNKDLIIEILLFLSTLCRRSADAYPTINQLNIFPDLKNLLENTNESAFKSRVCNLLGNMCRHTDFFYDQLKSTGIITPLLKCCYDNDKATRKFACFAIGNAAFLNDKLYDNFKQIIPRLVELLHDPEENTRANAAGALGNFVRCGDQLCGDIVKNKAHEALLSLAENEDNNQLQVIRVALFALGNFCNHQTIKNDLEKINVRQRIENLRNKFRKDEQLLEHIERIKKKLN